MSNPSKAKGTVGEHIAEDLLRPLWPDVERRGDNAASEDLRNTGDWIVEVKYAKAWSMFKWIRNIRRKAGKKNWAIVSIHGDRRTKQGKEVGEVVTVDPLRFIEMARAEYTLIAIFDTMDREEWSADTFDQISDLFEFRQGWLFSPPER